MMRKKNEKLKKNHQTRKTIRKTSYEFYKVPMKMNKIHSKQEEEEENEKKEHSNNK